MEISKYIQDFIAKNENLQKKFMRLSPSHKREYMSWTRTLKGRIHNKEEWKKCKK